LNTLGSFVSELCCRQTDRQTDKQTDSNILPTPTDRAGVGNKKLQHSASKDQLEAITAAPSIKYYKKTINMGLLRKINVIIIIIIDHHYD